MSLMKTLARVAAGVAVAKGVGAVMKGAQSGQSRSGGGLLDQLSQATRGQSSGGIGDMLGKVLGGQTGGAGSGTRYNGPNSNGASGGLGGILDSLTNQSRGSQSSGGIGDLLSQLGGGRGTRSAGGGTDLGGLLGGLLGGAAAGGAIGGLASKGAQQENDASFGELFNDAISRNGEPEVAPTPEQNAVAGLMLKAMIQAAKADGQIDDAEKQRLLDQLGDLDEDERAFIREEMAAPVDAAALAREVPRGLEAQVYLMSLMAIDFDSKAEAQYLHSLATAMGLEKDKINAIHDHVGVQNLYA